MLLRIILVIVFALMAVLIHLSGATHLYWLWGMMAVIVVLLGAFKQI